MEERYYKFSSYFKTLGLPYRVHKVTVDSGFSCPNRDGTISADGCIYCDNKGFSINTRKNPLSIEDQISSGINSLKRSIKAEKFIVYFQAYTNTYAPLDRLKEVYDTVKKFRDVMGISIATRPDCVNKEIIELIGSYAKDYDVWIEYGVQSAHDRTLEFINRGHSYKDFLKAVELTRRIHDIKICGHVILGLPGEDREMMLDTAKKIGSLKLEGLKIHPLHIIKGTKASQLYESGKIDLLDMDEYIDIVVRYLEYIWPGTVIQRISADCPKELLVAPLWILDKPAFLKALDKKLLERDTFQGMLFAE